MKKSTLGLLVILAYVNLLPCLCRLSRGLVWAAQYLPCPGHRLSGFLFLGVLFSIPAIPLCVAFLLRKRAPITYGVSVIVATVLLALFHYHYDLRVDPGIGLVVMIPAIAAVTGVIALVTGVVEVFVRDRLKATSEAAIRPPPIP
jgi:hypothetical protein